MNNEIIKCSSCNGFECHIVATDQGLLIRCWTCGDELPLKELYCMIHGHIISSEQAERLDFNDLNKRRIETACDRCGLDVIVRQNPKDETKYHITQIHTDVS
jgi:hypothetical protein